MQLNPSEISDLIKKRIEGFEATSEARSEGTIVSLTDGICRIHGLADVMQGEMIDFGNNLFGMALNLERGSVGAVVPARLVKQRWLLTPSSTRKAPALNVSTSRLARRTLR